MEVWAYYLKLSLNFQFFPRYLNLILYVSLNKLIYNMFNEVSSLNIH